MPRHKKPIDVEESLFYDKYFVFKKERAVVLAEKAINQLNEESHAEAPEVSISDVLERMALLQEKQYFCLNLDEEPAVAAMQEYYRQKYGEDMAKKCVQYIMAKDVGQELVFKGKCLVRGKVTESWRHPDGTKVYEVEDRQGGTHTVPESWVVKFLDAEPVGGPTA